MKEILNTIKERLKSPVVIIQIVTIIGTLVVVFSPELEDQVKQIVVAFTSVINIFAGMNNAADKENF